MLHFGKSRDCCREAFVGNVNGCDQERDQNAQLHIEIVEVCPALIEAEENCGCCHHVNGNAGETVADLEHGWLDDVSQLEAVLCQGSSERGRHGEQISDKAKQTVSRLIVRIAIAVLVDVDRRLGDGDQHQGDRLDHPMGRDTLLMVVALREHVLIGHRENAVRHQNQILNKRSDFVSLLNSTRFSLISTHADRHQTGMPRVENDAERFNRPVDDVHGNRLQQQQNEEVNDFREHRHFRRHFVLVVSG